MPALLLVRDWLQRQYDFPTGADEVHYVDTPDGVRLSLKRFLPRTEEGVRITPRRVQTPVLCVPGLGANSRNFDAPLPNGLAPWLARKGREVWVIDLRGTANSPVPKKEWRNITFDDFVDYDLPAAIPYICEAAGARSLDWLGHSMGGMVLYAMLARGTATQVRSAITLGTPIGFPENWAVAHFLKPVRKLAPHLPGLYVRRIMRAMTPFLLRHDNVPGIRNWLETKNVDPHYMRSIAYAAVEEVPSGLLVQFVDWIDKDVFRSKDQTFDYRARLAGAQLPVLVVSAPADKLGTPAATERALGLLENSESMVCGIDHGFSTDYGHVDIVFGREAPREIFPRFLAFLEAQDQRRPRLVDAS